MGFCTEDEYREFLRSCPEFERMLVRSGIILVKYWFSVSDEEQERRFQARIDDPTKRWKLSPMDLQSRARWVEYSKAKDEMFAHTDIKQAPWYVVEADDKKRARLNVIHHFLSLIPYEDLTPESDRAAAAPARSRATSARRGPTRRTFPRSTDRYQRVSLGDPRSDAGALAGEGQLEPGRPLRLGQVVADPLDRGPVARPDDLLVGLVEVVPARAVVLATRGAARHPVWSRTAKTAAVTIASIRRLVELVDEVEVVERLDVGRPEAGLLVQLAQRARR